MHTQGPKSRFHPQSLLGSRFRGNDEGSKKGADLEEAIICNGSMLTDRLGWKADTPLRYCF